MELFGRLVRNSLSLFLLFAVVLSPQLGQAQGEELLTVTVEPVIVAPNPTDASRQAVVKVTSDIAREQILDIIGEKRYQKNRALIESKIIRNAVKFIPIVTPGQPQAGKEGYKVPVEMKVSIESLRQLLFNAGLMQDSEGPANLVPMITFQDKIRSASYRWWVAEPTRSEERFLAQLNRALHQALYQEMANQGFYLIRPMTGVSQAMLPAAYRSERIGTDDLKFVSEYFRAPLVLRGEVRFRESREISGGVQCAVKIEAINGASGRAIGEVTRTYQTEPGQFETVVRNRMNTMSAEIAKDLSVQVYEAWQKGTLSTNLVRIDVRGALNPKQVNDFKSAVTKSVREIKSLKERLFESGRTVFEADISGGTPAFLDRFKGLSLPGFDSKMASASDSGVVLDVRATQ